MTGAMKIHPQILRLVLAAVLFAGSAVFFNRRCSSVSKLACTVLAQSAMMVARAARPEVAHARINGGVKCWLYSDGSLQIAQNGSLNLFCL